MQTKPLLYGLIGFFLGGFLVAVGATIIDKPESGQMAMQPAPQAPPSQPDTHSSEAMMQRLRGKTGDDFDKAFIADMIPHHEGAVDMAELAASNAKHDEIKQLSLEIKAAQEKEIALMKQWRQAWGYDSDNHDGHTDSHTH